MCTSRHESWNAASKFVPVYFSSSNARRSNAQLLYIIVSFSPGGLQSFHALFCFMRQEHMPGLDAVESLFIEQLYNVNCADIRHRAVRCTLQIRYCNGRPHEVQDMCVIRRRREAREPQNACEGGGGSRWVSPPIAVRIEKKDNDRHRREFARGFVKPTDRKEW